MRCPDCGAIVGAAAKPTAAHGTGAAGRILGPVTCTGCGRVFETKGSVLDLRPKEAFTEQTKYLAEALHQDARHESIAPPLLDIAGADVPEPTASLVMLGGMLALTIRRR